MCREAKPASTLPLVLLQYLMGNIVSQEQILIKARGGDGMGQFWRGDLERGYHLKCKERKHSEIKSYYIYPLSHLACPDRCGRASCCVGLLLVNSAAVSLIAQRPCDAGKIHNPQSQALTFFVPPLAWCSPRCGGDVSFRTEHSTSSCSPYFLQKKLSRMMPTTAVICGYKY